MLNMLLFFSIAEMFGPDRRASTQTDGENGEMDGIIYSDDDTNHDVLVVDNRDPIEVVVENGDEFAENDFDDGNRDAQFAENLQIIEDNRHRQRTGQNRLRLWRSSG